MKDHLMKYIFISSLFISFSIMSMSFEYSPFMALAANRQAKFESMLNEKTIDINKQDSFGNTLFHTAMMLSCGEFYIRALARKPNLRLDIKNNDNETSFNIGLKYLTIRDPASIRTFINIFPEHCKMAKTKYFSELVGEIDDLNPTPDTDNIKEILDLLIAIGITFDTSPEKSESFFKHLKDSSSNKRNEFYLSHIASGDFSIDNNSKKAPEFSLLTKDVHKKRPIDYAWEGKNLLVLIAMLDAGSPLPSKINIKHDLLFIKEHLKTLDAEKLSDTKSRLMTTNTARFIKNQQLGKRAVSRNLRINEKAKRIAKQTAFDAAVYELANIEID